MVPRAYGMALMLLMVSSVSQAKSDQKLKGVLPAYVLQARTVAVIIDPEAGVSLEDPGANRTAVKDVETVLMRWGRLEPVLSVENADLIVVVRKGSGKLVRETIPDSRQNDRPGVLQPTDGGILVGGQHGRRPDLSSQPPVDHGSQPTIEAGSVTDSFTVFEGKKEDPLDSVPAWRYNAKGGLHPHDVPAVEAFRKAILEAEKAAARKP